jgi:hypothetical protein
VPAPRRLSERLKAWLPEIVFLVATTIVGIWAGGRWVDPCYDGGFSWSLAYRLSQGERLYRDIYLPYMPGFAYLLAAGARFFGPTATYFLLVNWIPAIAAGFLLIRAGRSFLSLFERLALVGVVLATSIFAPGTGRLVWPYAPAIVPALALSVAALLLVRGDSARLTTRALFAGVLAGLTFSCKQEVGVAVLFALVAAALSGLPRPLAWLTRLAAGFLAVLLPLAAFVFSSAPIESLRADSHLWPLSPPPATTVYLMRAVTGITRPHLFRSARVTVLHDLALLVLLGLVAMVLAKERRRSAWLRVSLLGAGLGAWWLVEGHARGRPFPSLALSMSVALVVMALAFFTKDLPERPFLVSFAAFAALTGARTAFSTNLAGQYGGPGHFATALTSILFVVVFAPRILLGKTRSASYLRGMLALLVFALSWWQTGKAVPVLRYPENVAVSTRAGRVFTAQGNADVLRAIARNSTPGDRVLSVPGPHAIDAVFHLRAVSPLLDVLPGWFHTDMERRLIDRLEKDPPGLVVVWQRRFKEFNAEPFGVGYGLALNEWISRHYRVVESFPTGEVLRRK